MNEVHALRMSAGLSQSELAARSGVAQPNIAAYESGARSISRTMLERLAAAAPPRPSTVLEQHRAGIVSLARKHKVENVRIFGSVARGKDVSGSDLDLLVRFASDADIFDLAELREGLRELTGIHVDVISEGGLRSESPIDSEAIEL